MSQPGENKNRIEIGVAKRRDGYEAVALKRAEEFYEVVWGLKASSSDMSWDEFCQKIRSHVKSNEAGITLVQECGLIAYLEFEVPAIEDSQLDNIIRMQVDAKIASGDERLEYAWKKTLQEDGVCRVCVAVVKGGGLSTVATVAETLDADKVVLDVDAFVSLACKSCKEYENKVIFVRLYQDYVWLGFVDGGKVVSAVSLDHRLSAQVNDPENLLFAQDVVSAIDDVKSKYAGFGNRVCVAGCDEAVSLAVCQVLKSRQIEAEMFDCENAFEDLGSKNTSAEKTGENSGSFTEYADCVGGAIAAFDGYENAYDVFGSIYKNKKLADADSGKRKFVWQGLLILLVSVLTVLAFYASDKIMAAKYVKILDDEKVSKAVEAVQVRKEIAGERIEAGEILAKITEHLEKGVLLNSISFGRKKRVVLSGTCGDPKKLYSFQEKLSAEKMIKDVRVQSQGLDKKKGKTNFTISFDYKDYGKKR